MKFTRGIHITFRNFEYVHLELWGPSKNTTHSGGRYFMSIVDDFSRRVWVFVLKTKDEALINVTKNKQEKKLKYVRTDNGLEYMSHQFKELCSSKGL